MKLYEVTLKEDAYSEAIWFVADKTNPSRTVGPFNQSEAERRAVLWPDIVAHNGTPTTEQMNGYYYHMPRPWTNARPENRVQLVIAQIYEQSGNHSAGHDKAWETISNYYQREKGESLNQQQDANSKFRWGRVATTSINQGGIMITRGIWLALGEPVGSSGSGAPAAEPAPAPAPAPAQSSRPESGEDVVNSPEFQDFLQQLENGN